MQVQMIKLKTCTIETKTSSNSDNKSEIIKKKLQCVRAELQSESVQVWDLLLVISACIQCDSVAVEEPSGQRVGINV